MDVSKMTVVELKAVAYDTAVQIEQLNSQLRQLNQLIAQKIQESQNGDEKGCEEDVVTPEGEPKTTCRKQKTKK